MVSICCSPPRQMTGPSGPDLPEGRKKVIDPILVPLGRPRVNDLQVVFHGQVGEDPTVVGHIADTFAEESIGFVPLRSSPLNEMVPSFGGVSPMILRMVVLLPAPFRPRSPTTSPLETVREISKRT